jgi:splicing factor 3B subunit 5
MVNQHRDSIASYIGHPNMLAHFSVVENVSKERKRFELMQKMIQPCGPAPPPTQNHLALTKQ